MNIPTVEKISLPLTEEDQEQAAIRKLTRLFFIDHLRAVLVILVVLHHIAIVYGAGAPFYYVEPPFTDPDAFRVLLVFILVNQSWFMGAFFLLSGYFTPGSYDRKGAGSFLKDKFIRLGIPLIIFIFVLNPISELGVYLMPEALTGITDNPTWGDYPDMIGLGPVWFVAMLLFFNIGYVLWRKLTERLAFNSSLQLPYPNYLLVGGFTLTLALVSYGFRMIVPIGESVDLFVDWLSFPTIAYLPQYLSFFILGMVASRYDWFHNIPNTMGGVGLVAAVAAGVFLFPLAFSGEWFSLEITPALDNAMGDGHWQSGVYVLWDSIFAVGMCLALISLFRFLFNRHGWFGTLLAQQSYAVYLIHIPIIVYMGYLLRDVDWETLPKFGLASVIMLPICFGVAYLLRRIPFVAQVI